MLHVIRKVRSRMHIGITESQTRSIFSDEKAKTGLTGGGALILFGRTSPLILHCLRLNPLALQRTLHFLMVQERTESLARRIWFLSMLVVNGVVTCLTSLELAAIRI